MTEVTSNGNTTVYDAQVNSVPVSPVILSAGHNYSAHAKACNGFGWGVWSSAKAFSVMDVAPPVVTAPANVQMKATSIDGAWLYNWPAATVTAGDRPNPTVDYPPADPQLFSIGATTVTIKATDDLGNMGRASFQVTVNRGNRLLVPQDIVVEATGPSGAQVNFPVATITTNGNITYTDESENAVQSGDLFPLGSTAVQVTATYTDTTTETSWFWITVQDTIAPVVTLTPPGNITVPPNRPGGASNVSYPAASATDAVTANPVIWFDPPADGTVFPTGQTTTVTAYAMDSSGNTGTATFTVTVLEGPLTISNCSPEDGGVIFTTGPAIGALITDLASGASRLAYSMKLDGWVVTSNGNVAVSPSSTETKISFTPTALSQDWHSVEVTTSDDVGKSATVDWDFFVAGAGITFYDEGPPGGSTVDTAQPIISAFFAYSGGSLDPATLSVSVTSNGNISSPVYILFSDPTCFFAVPDTNLDPGEYTVTVSIGDGTNSPQTTSWFFDVPVGAEQSYWVFGLEEEDSGSESSEAASPAVFV